jgi:radical SAM protein with 4Fe4S-binding SPASM domain
MDIFSANQDSFTLHLRVTKHCNADCSYCSSYENDASSLMKLEDLATSLDFISHLILKHNLGGKRKMITVQYVGGEISTVPFDYLEQFVTLVKEKLSPLFLDFRHGAQSNLIASKSRINQIMDLFDSNIGTSIDNSTEQRTINKSAQRYQKIFLQNLDYSKKFVGKTLPAILVIDEKMKPFVFDEIEQAEKKKMHLTLRPVFQGGMPIEEMESESLTNLYDQIFDNWFMKSEIAIEPHFSLLQKRLLKYKKEQFNLPSYSGCPFQHNCMKSSLNMEPNGELYVCLDMADSNNYPIGNALTQTLDTETFNLLLSRSEKLNKDCLSCDYFNECQGGCMNEAIEHTGDVFGKTQYCQTWKAVFKKIDQGIDSYGYQNVSNWVEAISNTF